MNKQLKNLGFTELSKEELREINGGIFFTSCRTYRVAEKAQIPEESINGTVRAGRDAVIGVGTALAGAAALK